MRLSNLSSCAKACATLLASTAILFAGCNGAMTSTATNAKAITVTGNWQITAATSNATLPALSGELTGTSTSMTGIFHSNAASACVSPKDAFTVSGSADADNKVTLTGAVAGGTLTITGALAADGKSITNAAYSVSGGSCSLASVSATAQSYASVTGTYTGKFYDKDSATLPVLQMTATLTQSPASDTNGNFTLTGSANLGQNPCFTSPTAVSSAIVTGGSFTMTYTDLIIGNSVTASGTFSTDGKTLTITNWVLNGTCGTDSGTGVMTQQ
ncbi:hypothetical protein ACFQBQ_18385 [Granulicella cerasi]|uniref:Lipocalin-like domain-containing protein n=1 Tax=Granulicella cerasi TaxID=741063 RepID=A0ABW1Z4S1_9BACT|nr:hypothetical protein [Granulicella cerasi]